MKDKSDLLQGTLDLRVKQISADRLEHQNSITAVLGIMPEAVRCD